MRGLRWLSRAIRGRRVGLGCRLGGDVKIVGEWMKRNELAELLSVLYYVHVRCGNVSLGLCWSSMLAVEAGYEGCLSSACWPGAEYAMCCVSTVDAEEPILILISEISSLRCPSCY
jgi:hypothetical protein